MANPCGFEILVSRNASRTSSPVRLARIVVPPELPFPAVTGVLNSRSGISPPRRVPATCTWKKAVPFDVAAPYRTMSRSGLITVFGSVSGTSRDNQSANRPSIWTREGGEETKAGTELFAPIKETLSTSPGKNPGADTDTVIVSSGRPWVRFMDSAERDRIKPGVALNRKLDTCHVTDGGIAMARARIWNREVMPPPMTVVMGRVSTRTPPSAEESGTKLRLDAPRKSSAYTATRKSERSNRSMSYVDTLISSPPAEAAAWTEAPDCRRLQFTSESTGKEYNLAPATV